MSSEIFIHTIYEHGIGAFPPFFNNYHTNTHRYSRIFKFALHIKSPKPPNFQRFEAFPTDDAVTINVEWGKHTEKVEFIRKTEYMYAGSSFKFQAESDGTNSDVTYSTSNEDYAVIDEKSGLMTVK